MNIGQRQAAAIGLLLLTLDAAIVGRGLAMAGERRQPGRCDGATACADAPPTPIAEGWDYAPAMRELAARFTGRAGVVLHVGDSITYANPYGQWARGGAGQTDDDRTVLRWMHAGADDDSDGWYLARFDHPDGGRSYTAAGGLKASELLAGGKQNLPPLAALLDRYRPQVVVLMIGTNDASAGRAAQPFIADVGQAVELMLARGCVPVLSTIPPHVQRRELAAAYNQQLRKLAEERRLPLIDYEAEILARRPDDWDGTLLAKGDVHPTALSGGATPTSEPTAEHLANSGYLLRGWLSVRKIAEVKRRVFDAVPATAAGAAATAPAPADETLKLPITRDNWFSEVGDEALGNNGGSGKLKVKSIQEMSLVDFDPAPLVGHTVRSATLHLYGRDLKRITTSTFAAEWVEGTASGYERQAGSSCFRFRHYPDVPWTTPGSDLTAVTLGQGGTIWQMADASPPDAEGWQHASVAPAVVAARVAGISHGMLVFDDTGSEWTRDGEQFHLQLFPNRFFASRESGSQTAPYLSVALGEPDDRPPPAPGDFTADTTDVGPGETRLTWTTPQDDGPAGVAGFRVNVDGRPLPQWMVPRPGKPDERVELLLTGERFLTGNRHTVEVLAVDAAGNASPPARTTIVVAKARHTVPPLNSLVDAWPASREGAAPPPPVGARSLVVDELDKISPLDGRVIPEQKSGYYTTNHVSSPAGVTLAAARNEFVAFQLGTRSTARTTKPQLILQGAGADMVRVRWFRVHAVQTPAGPWPDALVPMLDEPAELPDRTARAEIRSYLCEIYVPPDMSPGDIEGSLYRGIRGEEPRRVRLHVWNFTLPDHLSFLPEMNCYDLPAGERDYYRLACEHRTVLNRVPYYQNGTLADGCAPAWDGQKLDWTAWDRRFAQYFDGTAFADLPRRGVPLECFYLPVHENWPSPMEGNYNGDYWADRAFPPAYRQALVEVVAQTAAHANEHRWHDTLFQLFLNGKNNFKAHGWSRGSSPWLLDEPANFQDYWALRWFGQAFHAGLARSRGDARFVFRCDISRPQWQRDALDDVLDYNVVAGGPFRQYRELVLERKKRLGQIVLEYGSANAVEQSNVQPVAWSIDAWCLGADGVVPWQTVGTAEAWQTASTECLFYPPLADGKEAGAPVPSIRLKAFRRGQQDVEYLTLLMQVTGRSREEIGAETRALLGLAGRREGTGVAGGEDAGRIDYGALRPQQLAAWRYHVARQLDAARPQARRKLVELRTPPRAAGQP